MRITNKDLELAVLRLNEATGKPTEPYTKQSDGTFKANLGNYHIDGAYGGVKLVQMCTEGGGIKEISTGGFGTKRELYNQIHAILNTIDS